MTIISNITITAVQLIVRYTQNISIYLGVKEPASVT